MSRIKSVEEFMSQMTVDQANLEYIAENGKINGSLLHSIQKLMKSYGEHVKDATLDKCRDSCGVIKVNGLTMTIPPSTKPILVLEQSNFELLKHSEDLKIE